MIKVWRFISLFLLTVLFQQCSVDEVAEPDHIMIYEKSDEQIEINLTWKINGVDDEGMLADVMLYISRSKDMSDAALDESLGVLTLSYMDYYGNQRIVPSRRNLFDAYRFYMGVAYHGLTTANASVTFPLTIDYEINIVNQKTREKIKTINKSMVIQSNDPDKTRIDYIYSLDVIENEPEAEFRNYSFRELSEPISVNRASDIISANTFSAEKNLYADMIWKVNGEVKGFAKIDLDLFLHDTNNTNIINNEDLDDNSSNENAYEGITILPTSSYFRNQIPEKLGFYFYDNLGATTPATIEYMYRLYSLDGKIKRHIVKGSFLTPPVKSRQGTFYFDAEILKSNNTYIVRKLPAQLVWTP